MESTELENNNVQNEETSSSSIPQIQKVGESSQSKKGIKKKKYRITKSRIIKISISWFCNYLRNFEIKRFYSRAIFKSFRRKII